MHGRNRTYICRDGEELGACAKFNEIVIEKGFFVSI